ncbi:CarD family transcriptional regulator [Paenibacillus chibensis]|uniref:CarD family transcriptional regulator n=1 Tax=Paenibacillus chibensis TaxID=59846 RepID=UPI000FD9B2C7|nr:CarD family transcriptional regulator [Paenibacillus chibensis]MEC0371788.1 CarD family transcriptional regulator [Paenibacillus chibensis]
MYQIGDLIHYGDTGVCRITDIKLLDIARSGDERLYYVLDPLYQACSISTPVENNRIFMRPIISKEEAERLIDMIPSIHAEAYHSRVQRELVEHYESSLKTHDCEVLIRLTMSIHAKKQTLLEDHKKMGAVDESFMKKAEHLLFSELSAALDIPIAHVPEYIESRVDAIRAK